MRRLEVIWVDSTLVAGGWGPPRPRRWRREVRCHSVGYVLADDKRGVVLAASLQGGNVFGVVVIPASAILRRRKP